MTKFFRLCIPAACLLLAACSSAPELLWTDNPVSGVSAAASGDRVLLSRNTEQQIITIFSADTIKIFSCEEAPYFFLCALRTGGEQPLLLRISLPDAKLPLNKYRIEEMKLPENLKSVDSVAKDGTAFTGTTDKGTETLKAVPVK